MKKTFRLQAPGKEDARVLDAVKTEIRKYVKRERRKTVPEGFDYWDFDCKAGADAASATIKPVKQVTDMVDEIAKAGGTEVYVEIIAVPRKAEGAATNADPLEINPPSEKPSSALDLE